MIGSIAQGFALLFYLFFDSLTSLYLISAMFGLFQGGIVPSYAIIVREAMPASRGRDPRRHRDLRLRVRHVVRRLGLRRDLRRHRLLCGGVPQRAGWNALNVTIMAALLFRARAAAGAGVTPIEVVIASEAKQSMAAEERKLDCFVRCAPRNDERVRILYTACPALSRLQPVIFRLPSDSCSSV